MKFPFQQIYRNLGKDFHLVTENFEDESPRWRRRQVLLPIMGWGKQLPSSFPWRGNHANSGKENLYIEEGAEIWKREIDSLLSRWGSCHLKILMDVWIIHGLIFTLSLFPLKNEWSLKGCLLSMVICFLHLLFFQVFNFNFRRVSIPSSMLILHEWFITSIASRWCHWEIPEGVFYSAFHTLKPENSDVYSVGDQDTGSRCAECLKNSNSGRWNCGSMSTLTGIGPILIAHSSRCHTWWHCSGNSWRACWPEVGREKGAET